jgi:DNA-binding NarL/FixJ family response regulator
MRQGIPPSSSETRKRILLVDDHPIVRQGLSALLEHEPDLEICGEADDPDVGLDRIEELRPDIVLSDLSFGGLSGIEFIKDIRARWPKLPVLILSMHDEVHYADRALRAGAMGYIMKQAGGSRVIEAIRQVVSGQIYLSPEVTTQLVRTAIDGPQETASSPIDQFSDRELEVFALIGQGLSTRQIAKKLHLSTKTIDSHRSKIKSKLNLKNSTELVHHAIRWFSNADGLTPQHATPSRAAAEG